MNDTLASRSAAWLNPKLGTVTQSLLRAPVVGAFEAVVVQTRDTRAAPANRSFRALRPTRSTTFRHSAAAAVDVAMESAVMAAPWFSSVLGECHRMHPEVLPSSLLALREVVFSLFPQAGIEYRPLLDMDNPDSGDVLMEVETGMPEEGRLTELEDHFYEAVADSQELSAALAHLVVFFR